jgi:hypothetical protein
MLDRDRQLALLQRARALGRRFCRIGARSRPGGGLQQAHIFVIGVVDLLRAELAPSSVTFLPTRRVRRVKTVDKSFQKLTLGSVTNRQVR